MNVNWPWSRCQQYRRMISLRAGGDFTDAERASLDAHLAVCSRCRAHLEQITRIARGLSEWRDSIAAVEPDTALRTRWEQAVASTVQPPRPVRAPGLQPWATAVISCKRHALARHLHAVLRPVLGPRRVGFAGLASVWLLILFFNVTAPDPGEMPPTPSAPPRALLAILTTRSQPTPESAADAEPAAHKPRLLPGRPRGDLGSTNLAG